MRFAVIIAALCIVACSVSVCADSSDWAAPAALGDAWSSDLSVSELEARHTEFIMQLEGSSSGPTLEGPTVSCLLDCTLEAGARQCDVTPQDFEDIISSTYTIPDEAGDDFSCTFESAFFGEPDASNSTNTTTSSTGGVAPVTVESSSAAEDPIRRRLLAVQSVTKSVMTFAPGSNGDAKSNAAYSAFVASLECKLAGQTDEQYKACLDAIPARFPGFGFKSLSESPKFMELAAVQIPGEVDAAVIGGVNNGNNVESVGGPRRTNGGYYFLGALVLLFAVIALVYFIVHKKPVDTIVKEEPLRRDEVAMAPVVAAPAASGVVVANEDAPLAAGSQQQMDYRSVFALKHNVLDKNAEQKAAEDDEHNHNDVHFILHQSKDSVPIGNGDTSLAFAQTRRGGKREVEEGSRGN